MFSSCLSLIDLYISEPSSLMRNVIASGVLVVNARILVLTGFRHEPRVPFACVDETSRFHISRDARLLLGVGKHGSLVLQEGESFPGVSCDHVSQTRHPG